MSDTVRYLILVAGGITAVGTIGGALLWLLKPRIIEWFREEMQPTRDQVERIHKQVTENHHSNEHPTVLDLLDDVRQDVRKLTDDFSNHLLLTAHAQADMWRAIEAVAKADPPQDP